LLKRVERRVVQGTERRGKRGVETELEKEEIKGILRRVKEKEREREGKAMGVNGIPRHGSMEAWR